MGRDAVRHRENREQAVRITTAGTSAAQDIADRQRRYLLSMTIRSVCFVGAVVSFLAGVSWLWPFLIAAALVLPYVAVVMANNRNSKSDSFQLLDHGNARRQLPGGPDPRHTGGADHI